MLLLYPHWCKIITMSKERTIMILGIITAIMPRSGLPTAWKQFLLVVFSIIIASLASYLIKEKKAKLKITRENTKGNTYIENRNFLREKELETRTEADLPTEETKSEI